MKTYKNFLSEQDSSVKEKQTAARQAQLDKLAADREKQQQIKDERSEELRSSQEARDQERTERARQADEERKQRQIERLQQQVDER
jgi:hypothetical protein